MNPLLNRLLDLKNFLSIFLSLSRSFTSLKPGVCFMTADSNGYQDGLGDGRVSREIVDIICEQYSVEKTEVYRRSSLSDFGVSGQNRINFGMHIEDRFELSTHDLDDDTVDGWDTVQDAINYVESIIQE